MPKSSSPKPVNELKYEAAFAELETIMAVLEGEQRPLDESLRLYERGQALAKRCAELLNEAELKVSRLSGEALDDFEEDR